MMRSTSAGESNKVNFPLIIDIKHIYKTLKASLKSAPEQHITLKYKIQHVRVRACHFMFNVQFNSINVYCHQCVVGEI